MPGRKPNYYPSNDIEEELKAFIKECEKAKKEGIQEISSGLLIWDSNATQWLYLVYEPEKKIMRWETNGNTAMDSWETVEGPEDAYRMVRKAIEEPK